jgi:arsenate reductase (glutaredoxin)
MTKHQRLHSEVMQRARGAVAVSLLHNARCSKSRAALALLREREGAETPFPIKLTVRDYLKEPLGPSELAEIAGMLPDFRSMVRAADFDKRAKEVQGGKAVSAAAASREELIAAIASEPKLLERPIAVVWGAARAAVGRPPTNVLELLDDLDVEEEELD